MADTASLVVRVTPQGIKESRQQLDRLAEGGGIAEKSTNNLSRAMKALGAVVSVAVFTRWIKGALNAADAAAKTADATNLTVEQVQRLDLAFSLGTQRAVDMTMVMSQLNKAISEGRDTFDDLGVAVVDAETGALRPVHDVLLDVSDAFSQLSDDADKSAAAADLFGQRYGPNLLPLLNQGSAAIEELGDRAERLGLVVSEDAARGAEEFNDNLSLIGSVSRGVANQLMTEMLPTMNNLTNVFLDVTEDGEGVQKLGEGLSTIFRLVSSAGTIVATVFQVVGDRLGALAASVMSAVSGDFSGALDILRQTGDNTVEAIQGATDRLQKIWSDQESDAEASSRRQLATMASLRDGLEKQRTEAEEKEDERRQRELEKEQNRLQRLRETFATEAELEEMRFEQKMARFQEFAEIEALSEMEKKERLELLEQDHQERMNGIREKGMTDAQRIQNAGMSAQVGIVAGEMGNMLRAYQAGGSKFIKAAGVLSSTQALIATWTGQAEALKLGWPMGFIAAAKIGAAGLGFVSSIQGLSGGGGGGGGKSSRGGGSAPSLSSPQPQAERQQQRQGLSVRIDLGGRTLIGAQELGDIMSGIAERTRDGDATLREVLIT